ncbi:alpha/beta fold hydrolase [Paenibacillus sp. JX-17]|uniref:Alpha/beta fold hydrolase n=1 Tax=Paenibacillus lacisoli TaxID=3064525 RepID=A0ABT9CC58_9BACL|nr:alpha/beta fold hydrolase [Paenibacillus sp. JX-17]MDO7906234.1 alpha/beta fold hydrolase [Paenibacillus sp. JX-17]
MQGQPKEEHSMSKPFTEADGISVSDSTPVMTFSPVVLSVPGRIVDLQIKVSAPSTGSGLPVILLSHGHGPSNFISSLHGYGPLADFWAAHGFVVIQPTHLDSMMLGLRETQSPEAPLYWRSRAEDMRYILDQLDHIEAAVPGLGGRIDKGRIAAVGHSLGGLTVGMLCGQGVTDPVDGKEVNLLDPRIKAGVLLAAPGRGEDLSAFATEHYPVLRSTSFANMTTPALIVVGENDWSPRFSNRKDWRSDAYYLSPGPKCLLTLIGAEHGLGGIASYDAAETTDENPERVAVLRALVWSYLRSALYPEDAAWHKVCVELKNTPNPLGIIECKSG